MFYLSACVFVVNFRTTGSNSRVRQVGSVVQVVSQAFGADREGDRVRGELREARVHWPHRVPGNTTPPGLG